MNGTSFILKILKRAEIKTKRQWHKRTTIKAKTFPNGLQKGIKAKWTWRLKFAQNPPAAVFRVAILFCDHCSPSHLFLIQFLTSAASQLSFIFLTFLFCFNTSPKAERNSKWKMSRRNGDWEWREQNWEHTELIWSIITHYAFEIEWMILCFKGKSMDLAPLGAHSSFMKSF